MMQIVAQPQGELVSVSTDGTSSGSTVGILIVAIAVLLVAALALRRALDRLRRPALHGTDLGQIKKTFAELERTSEQGMMGAKLAIIETDKLLDNVLRSMMMRGETLGERLKFAAYKYPELRNVWNAHKLRNQLVHDATIELMPWQVRSAMQDYRRALRTLHVL